MGKKFDLSALIQESVPAQVGQKEKEFQLIPLEKLVENEKNALFPIVDEELDDLVNSVHAVGLTEPLTVTPMNGGTYRIVSGHRRGRAIKVLADEHPEDERWKAVPCYVKKYKSAEDEELALIYANTQVRKDKSWMYPAAIRIRALLAAKMERDGTKYRGKMQGIIAEFLNTSRQELQRQEYIAEHLEPAVRERWPNLATHTANTIAHMPPEHQRELASRYPEWMERPSNYITQSIAAALRLGNDWFEIEERRHKEKLRLEAEEERKKEERRKATEERKAERKKRDDDYRTELALKMAGVEVEPKEKPSPKAPTINWGYDDKVIMERFKAAREMAKSDVINIGETTGYANITDILEAVKEYHVSADYLLGLTEYPQITPVETPTPAAPQWKLITEDNQPHSDWPVETAVWQDGKWYRGRLRWHPHMLREDTVMMWTESIPLPPPPEEEEEVKLF